MKKYLIILLSLISLNVVADEFTKLEADSLTQCMTDRYANSKLLKSSNTETSTMNIVSCPEFWREKQQGAAYELEEILFYRDYLIRYDEWEEKDGIVAASWYTWDQQYFVIVSYICKANVVVFGVNKI